MKITKIVLVTLFVVLILISVVFTITRYLFIDEFYITAEVPCDNQVEGCIVVECEVLDEDEFCVDGFKNVKYFTYKTNESLECDIFDESCQKQICNLNNAVCKYSLE